MQSWIDDGEGMIRYEGERIDGAMHLSGTHASHDGTIEPSRMSLTAKPDGTVIQRIDPSRDQGQTWYLWFEGIDVRRGPAGTGRSWLLGATSASPAPRAEPITIRSSKLFEQFL
jgi:hypothetical protein